MELLNKIKQNYKSGILVFLGTLLVIFVLMPQNNKQTKTPSTNNYNLADREPEPDFQMDSPTEIKWLIEDKQFPEEVLSLIVVKPTFSKERFSRILEMFGLAESDKTGEQGSIGFYGNDRKFAFIDEANNQIEYSKNVESKKDISGTWVYSTDEIKDKLNEEVVKITGNNNLQMVIEEAGFKKFVYPRTVTTDDIKQADMISYVGRYAYKTVPIVTFTNELVKATYGLNGDLIKLDVQVPPEVSDSTKKMTLLTLDQVKRQPMNKFKVWKIEGGANYDLSGGEQIIKRMNATDVSLGYIYDQKENLWPYYFVTGNSFPESGPVKVTLIVSAVDESQKK